MSSSEGLKEFVNERLTAAAEEIFRVFSQTIIEYEKEIDRQRRQLDIIWKPEIKLHPIELPQYHVQREQEVLTDQRLHNQERNSSLDQENPEPPRIKEEQEERCTSQEGEQLLVRQETDTFVLTPAYEESDHSEPEPESDHQLLSDNSHVAENQDQNEDKHGDSGSSRETDSGPKERRYKFRSLSNSVYKHASTGIQTDLPQHHVYKKEEVLTVQQLCNQEKNSSLDQEDPEPPQIKEEQEKLCTSQDDSFMLIPPYEGSDHSEPEPESDWNSNRGKKPFKCDSCGKKCNDKSKLIVHMRTHTGEKPYICKTCGEGFIDIYRLKKHLRIVHNGEKPYPCNTCGKGFSSGRALTVHMRNHTGEKPFSCIVCRRDFRIVTDLKNHMRIHTVTPYSCLTCEKVFPRLSALSAHLRVYSCEKPYGCKTCGKGFTDPSQLRKHMSIHAELQQQHVHKQEEVLADQQLCNQERNSSLDQEDPEPPQIKEGQEELCTSQEGEQLVVQMEPDNFMLIPPYEGSDHSEPEPESDHQLLSDCNSKRGGKSFKCDSCGKECKDMSKLIVHVRTHTGERPFICKTCGKGFIDIYGLEKHLRIDHTSEKPYSCNTCGKGFSRVWALTVHMRNHTGEKPFSCIVCRRDFRIVTDLKNHMRIHTVTPYSCLTCEKVFPRLRALTHHLRVYSCEKPYGCKTCGKGFADPYKLRKHMSIHAELQQQHVYKQDEVLADQQLCNQERNSSLDQEDPEPPQIKEGQEELRTSHEGEQLVVKMETDTLMLTPAFEDNDHSEPEPESDHQLLSDNPHVAESQDLTEGKHGDSEPSKNTEPEPNEGHHTTRSPSTSVDKPNQSEVDCNSNGGKKSFKCDVCGKDFKHKSKLNVHMRSHTGERPYSCKTCGKRFSAVYVLKVHMRTHTGEKPYPCKTCGKRFRNSSNLSDHMKNHTSEKPYSCNTCGKGFSRRRALKVHMRIHTGEKPFVCKTCGKRYSDISGLRRHLRIHTGEKPYSCNTCGKGFSLRNKWSAHLRVHTVERPHICQICGKGYAHSSRLKRHLTIHTELQQQHVHKEEEFLADQQLCNQERNSSLDQDDPEPPQIKEGQEEL